MKKPGLVLIVVISAIIPLVVALLLALPGKGDGLAWAKSLPHVNGVLNTITSLLLVVGYLGIKKGKQQVHKYAMLGSFLLGALFLISYVLYHASVPSTPYGGLGLYRYVYYATLISHVFLSIAVVPLVLMALYYALNGNFVRHRRIVRYAWPVWLYVSVTGVAVYLMISPYYA